MAKSKYPRITVRWLDADRISNWATAAEHIQTASSGELVVVSSNVLLLADTPDYILVFHDTQGGDQFLSGIQIPRQAILDIKYLRQKKVPGLPPP